MNYLQLNFSNNFDAQEAFPSETAIRNKPEAFRGYCYRILDRRGLPLSHAALSLYLHWINDTGQSSRKDKITWREQHEESHLVTLDALLKAVGTQWIDEKKYGSIDVLFTACILHDVIEDLKISEKSIANSLRYTLERMYKEGLLSDQELQTKKTEINQAVKIVTLLSRTDEHGRKIAQDDRIEQAKRWLEHPYAYIIKMIDWSNKLQTMAGVEHFENDDLAKMKKVLNETGLLFVNEQQGFTDRAIERYPFMEDVYQEMEGIMGILFQTLNTYQKLKTGEVNFDPQNAFPFNFDEYFAKSARLIAALPTGNNYINPLFERLDAMRDDDTQISSFLDHMVKPAFESSKQYTPALKIR